MFTLLRKAIEHQFLMLLYDDDTQLCIIPALECLHLLFLMV